MSNIKLWNHQDPIVWHFPKPDWTIETIAADPSLSHMLNNEVILITDEQGRVFEWTYLDMWKSQYGVEIEDPQDALEQCLINRNIPKITQDDIVQMVDALGTATVENTDALDDVQDQIDLMGAAVEELISLQLS